MPYWYQSVYFDRTAVKGRALDIFMPERAGRSRALFFVHGGGWRAGSRLDQHRLMEAFNGEGFVCAATDYRLQGSTILDQLTDVRHGYEIFAEYLAGKGLAPEGIVVHGSSAGGHLAALLAMAPPGECGESRAFGDYALKATWTPPAAAVLAAAPLTFEPWEDIFPLIWSSMESIVGVPYERRPDLYRRVSPSAYLSERTPPVFIAGAANEHMFPLEQNEAFAARARALGRRAEHKVYTSAEHGFFYDVTRRQQKELFADFVAFVESL